MFFPKLNHVHAFDYGSSASSMIVMEQSTGLIVAQKNAHDIRTIASTTKILTAITAIENSENLNKIVKINPKAVGVEGSSIYLKKGEQMTLLDLLYGLMLRSGNDAAMAIAYEVGGTIEDFVKMMNETAKKAGAKNSSFKNPHGLDEKDHHSTAYDLACITAYALNNKSFADICASTTVRTKPIENTPVRLLVNKNKLLRMATGAIGIKTGFTKKSGRTFVGAIKKDELIFIAVVLNCGPMFEESKRLLETAHSEYMLLSQTFDKKYGVQVNGSELGYYPAYAKEQNFSEVIKRIDKDNYTIEEYLNADMTAPLLRDSVVGRITVKNKGEIVFETDILLDDNAHKQRLSLEQIFMLLLR